MTILDTPDQYKKIDPSSILQNIVELPDQIAVVWQEMKKFALPSHYIQCNKVVLAGMGGSSMGAGLVKTLTDQTSKLPIEMIRNYDLPAYADSKTLVIGVSYSGSTEETLSAVEQARKKDCKIIGIASGANLEAMSRKYQFPFYKINYGSQPRAALGYTYTAILAIFNKLGLVNVSDDDIKQTVSQMKNGMKKIAPEVSTVQNPAKQLAQRLQAKIPVIVGAGIMQEVARRYKSQFNENAKSAAFFEIMPEMNHNAITGTEFPRGLDEQLFIILLASRFDHPRNQLRIDLTQQILEKRKIPFEVIQPTPAANPIAEQMLSIHFIDFTSYYLALLYNVDPEKIEIVDFLKKALGRAR